MTIIRHPLSLIISLLSYACCLSLYAAVSSLATADEYVFTRPALTNNIHGIVCGDTTNCYGTLRYEDEAWLNEAYAERSYLASTHLRTTNEWHDIQQNLKTNPAAAFKPTPYITRPPVFEDAELFLDPNLQPISTPKKIDNLTNTYEALEWVVPTNQYHSATNYIRQTMTNGMVNVWTNLPATYVSNVVKAVYYIGRDLNGLIVTNGQKVADWNRVTTNVVTLYDMLFPTNVVTLADTRQYAELTKTRGGLNFWYSKYLVTNLYSMTRFARLTTPRTISTVYPMTNATEFIRSSSEETTNRVTTSTSFSAEFTHSVLSEDHQTRYGEDWVSDDGSPTNRFWSYGSYIKPDNLTLKLVTNIPYEVSRFKYDRSRISCADVFLSVHSTHEKRIRSSYSTQDGYKYAINTNVITHGWSIVPVGIANSTSPTNGYETLEVNVDPSALINGCETAGVPFFTETYVPPLPDAGEAEWLEDGNKREKVTEQYCLESLFIYFDTPIVILHLNPKTKLSTWSEYE